VDYFDMSSSPGKDSKPVREIIDGFVRPFDLARAPLMRVGLIKLQKTSHALMVDMHHIITDGVSNGILLGDILSLYKGEQLPALKLQYKDYTHWQQSKEGKETLEKQEKYWLKEFEGEIPLLNLPYDTPRPAIQSFAGSITSFEVSAEETKSLQRAAQTQEATLFMALLGVYYILLSKLGSQEEIVVGTPIAGRNHADLEPIIGIFINMLALKNKVNPEQSYAQLLEHLKQRTLEAFENQDYQFDDLVENLELEKDTARHPLFDVMMVLQNVYDVPGAGTGQKRTGLAIRPFSHEHRTSQYDLTFTAIEQGNEKLYVEVEYCTALFQPATIDRYIEYFKTIISTVTRNPGLKIENIEIAAEAEKKQILEIFNKTAADYPKEKTLRQLWVEQVEKAPDRVALVGRHQTQQKDHNMSDSSDSSYISYKELNEQSHRWAILLKEKGIKPGTIVGIMMERSPLLIMAMLAVLKAGAAYLPIEPQIPPERKLYMLTDSGAKILLAAPGTQVKVKAEVEERFIEKIDIYDLFPSCPSTSTCQVSPANLAYLIYTSGTTGKPKGVMARHKGITRLVKGSNYIQWTPGEKLLPTGAIAFDITTFEIWGPLLNGLTLILEPQDIVLNGDKLAGIIARHHVSILHLIPQLLNQWLDTNTGIFSRLDYFLVGGDLVRPYHVNRLRKINPNLKILHMYGPTENTTFSTYFPVDRDYEHTLPIGKPIANSTVYIMDRCQQLLPIGVPGELTVGGDGLAIGYLNNPELTAEKFISRKKTQKDTKKFSPHYPNTPIPHYPIYITGDLAKWQPDGNIQFLGRQDLQVKIRGNRIELEEIENHLLKHQDIKEAVVLARVDKNREQPYLCAYIVPHREITVTRLRDSLSAFLPEYMIPAYFVQLEALPLNPNGKINRKALPHPEENLLEDNTPYEAPRNEIEKQLVQTWEKVLGKENIGINDNFFMTGGDSIKAIQIIAQMKKAGYKMEMKDLYQNRRISGLAPFVKRAGRTADQSVITGIIPLTPIQEDFFAAIQIHPHHFNQSLMLQAKQGFSAGIIKKVFTRIQEHHDVLRMTYKREGNRVIQTNHGLEYPLEIQEFDLRNNENPTAALESACNLVQAGIDLEKGPLMQLGLFHLEEEDRLLIAIHHLVMDGISWRILLEDMAALYSHYKSSQNDRPPALPLKSDPFKYWAEKLLEYAGGKEIIKEVPYWREIEKTFTAPLPKDHTPAPDQLKKSCLDSVNIDLEKENTGKLLDEIHRAYNTEINDILLTALALAIHRWTGGENILVNLEGHGREEIMAEIDISRTIGWFTSRYPVILQIPPKDDTPDPGFLSRLIKQNKEQLRKIPNKGIGYGILRTLAPTGQKGDLTFNREPEISFNYLGQMGQTAQESSNEPGLFTISTLDMGSPFSPEQIPRHVLEINGMVTGGRLVFSLTYNRHQYDKSTITTLARRYKDSLLEIIGHCMKKDDTEKTLSDYTVSDMDEKELENVYDALGDLFK
jgi:amino acid adenylation domain-containing protein/non-ribosomal peptide synthase protein (TIGR01720 family)